MCLMFLSRRFVLKINIQEAYRKHVSSYLRKWEEIRDGWMHVRNKWIKAQYQHCVEQMIMCLLKQQKMQWLKKKKKKATTQWSAATSRQCGVIFVLFFSQLLAGQGSRLKQWRQTKGNRRRKVFGEKTRVRQEESQMSQRYMGYTFIPLFHLS